VILHVLLKDFNSQGKAENKSEYIYNMKECAYDYFDKQNNVYIDEHIRIFVPLAMIQPYAPTSVEAAKHKDKVDKQQQKALSSSSKSRKKKGVSSAEVDPEIISAPTVRQQQLQDAARKQMQNAGLKNQAFVNGASRPSLRQPISASKQTDPPSIATPSEPALDNQTAIVSLATTEVMSMEPEEDYQVAAVDDKDKDKGRDRDHDSRLMSQTSIMQSQSDRSNQHFDKPDRASSPVRDQEMQSDVDDRVSEQGSNWHPSDSSSDSTSDSSSDSSSDSFDSSSSNSDSESDVQPAPKRSKSTVKREMKNGKFGNRKHNTNKHSRERRNSTSSIGSVSSDNNLPVKMLIRTIGLRLHDACL
jgi:hypothetical protein